MSRGRKNVSPPQGQLPEDTFKILIASDIHLGFGDNLQERELDCYTTFEEILQMAKDEKVDFMLLGGDLFHENKPKPDCIKRTMELFQKYCLGSNPVEFDYLGDPITDFKTEEHNAYVNYQNPNINIELPVFTIHGNHDDPIGSRRTSAVDHLSVVQLVNHFGQWSDLNQIDIRPVCLRKGKTFLALYGLGNIKDERLNRLMRFGQVRFFRDENKDKWFNIFTLHQNRVKHGEKNYIPEEFIPPWFNMVIWGHEHECKINPSQKYEEVPSNDGISTMFIVQPGSPVATSLAQGESVDKHVGVLYVHEKEFKMEIKKLQTVRPLLMKDLYAYEILENIPFRTNPAEYLENYVTEVVKQLIIDSTEKLSGHEKQPIKPLIRVRIFYDNEDHTFSPVRFSQKFAAEVQNDDIVMFKKMLGKKKENMGDIDVEDINDMIMNQEGQDLTQHIEEIVETHFKDAREREDKLAILDILSEKGLSEAVKQCVEKDDREAIGVIIDSNMEKTIKYLQLKIDDLGFAEEESEAMGKIDQVLEDLRNARVNRAEQESAEAYQLLKGRPGTKRARRQENDVDETNEDEEEVIDVVSESDEEDSSFTSESSSVKGSRGRGAKGRGSRGGKTSASTSSSTGRGRGRGSRATANSSSSRARGKGSRGSSIQTTLTKTVQIQPPSLLRTSPRKNKSRMVFDDDSD